MLGMQFLPAPPPPPDPSTPSQRRDGWSVRTPPLTSLPWTILLGSKKLFPCESSADLIASKL